MLDNTQNYTRIDVEDTPFGIIENSETKKAIIVIGNQMIIDKEFENTKEAKLYVKNKPWDLIINASAMFAQYCIKQSKSKEEHSNA